MAKRPYRDRCQPCRGDGQWSKIRMQEPRVKTSDSKIGNSGQREQKGEVGRADRSGKSRRKD
jgi:hypothetical protein